MIVGVIGGSRIKNEDKIYKIAYQLGKLIAENGWILICGGLGGVMEAASKGAYEHNGITVGIIPFEDKSYANKYIKIPIASGMGLARNYIIVNTADILIAVDGSYGTLNEISAALNVRKKVLTLFSWEKLKDIPLIEKELFIPVKSPEEAIEYIKNNERA